MQIKKNQILDVYIQDFAFGGTGIAKIPSEDRQDGGYTIFVEHGIVGDFLSVSIYKKKKSFAFARIEEIKEASPLRVKPPCAYFSHCGGCKWQNLSYEKQLFYKKKAVAEALEHIAFMKDVEVEDIAFSEEIYHYRNKVEFSATNYRWLLKEELENKDIKKDIGIGFHLANAFNKIIDIKECYLQNPLGNKILNDIRIFVKESELKAYDSKKREGFWRFFSFRHSKYYDNFLINIVTAYENDDLIKKLSDILISKYKDKINSVVNNITSKIASVASGEYEKVFFGKNYIKEKIKDFDFKISANSFFQSNTKVTEKLYETIKDFADPKQDDIILDLYCGAGTISIFLSSFVNKVIGVDIVEDAISNAKENCEINKIENCSFFCSDAKNFIKEFDDKINIMILDPPRSGVHKDLLKEITRLLPEKIVYVSCNPATLARDILSLKENYDILKVQPFDMFPHTYHVEVAVCLKLRLG